MEATTEVINLSSAMAAQETLRIDPREIYADPSLNTRSKKLGAKDIAALKEDIRERGVQQNVRVFISDGSEGMPEAGVPVLVFGFTRVQIAKELIEETGEVEKYKVPYLVDEKIPTKLEAFEANLAENFNRNNLTTWDTVLAIIRLEEEFGIKDAKKIAARFGKSDAWVRQHRRLYSDLHPEIQKRLALTEKQPGFVPGSVAMELLNIEDKDEQLAALKAAEMDGDGGVATRDAVKSKVAEAAEQGKAPIKAKTAKQLLILGETYTTKPEQGEDEDEDAYKERVEQWKADPLTYFFSVQNKFISGKMKEKAYIKAMREVVVAKGSTQG